MYCSLVSANKCTFYPLLSIQGGINTTCSCLLLGLRRTGSNKLNNLRKCVTTTVYMSDLNNLIRKCIATTVYMSDLNNLR